ncbi:MAG: hypothetical protein V1647_04260, partial [Pseudomonadota bacterium]
MFAKKIKYLISLLVFVSTSTPLNAQNYQWNTSGDQTKPVPLATSDTYIYTNLTPNRDYLLPDPTKLNDPDGFVKEMAEKISCYDPEWDNPDSWCNIDYGEIETLKYICVNGLITDAAVLKQLTLAIARKFPVLYELKNKEFGDVTRDALDHSKSWGELFQKLVVNGTKNAFYSWDTHYYNTNKLIELTGYIAAGYGTGVLKEHGLVAWVNKFATEYNDDMAIVAEDALIAMGYGDINNLNNAPIPIVDKSLQANAPKFSETFAEGPATIDQNTGISYYDILNNKEGQKVTPADPSSVGSLKVLTALARKGGLTKSEKDHVTNNSVIDLERAERKTIKGKEEKAMAGIIALPDFPNKDKIIQGIVNDESCPDAVRNMGAQYLKQEKPVAAVTFQDVMEYASLIADIGLITASPYKAGIIGELKGATAATELNSLRQEVYTAEKIFNNTYKFTDVTQTVEITGVVGTVVLRAPIIKSLPEVATQVWTIPSVNNAILLQDLAFTTRLASVTTYSMTMVNRVGKTYDVNFKDKIVKPVTIEALTSRAELPTRTMLITITTSAGTITYLVPIITAVDEKALL